MGSAKEQAMELAVHYFRLIAKRAGALWTEDNDAEIREMIRLIIEAAKE